MKIILLLASLLVLACNNAPKQKQQEQHSTQQNSGYYTPSQSDTWVATDALDRTIEDDGRYPEIRSGKTIGLFYFIWQGGHGYDRHTNTLPDERVMPIPENDTNSPYNITEMLRENPDDPQYGPDHAFHHWGEPYMGYYVANDKWVIRKHAQMMADAGVDVIFLDVTNASLYLPTVSTIGDVYREMRKEGNKTPDIAFLLNTNPEKTMERLYNNFYKKGLYEDLWFIWKGKPLVLSPPEGITPEMAEFFSVRQSWFASSWPWFGDGKDKWTWSDFYPQKAGWHESPDQPEALSVSAATHATSNIGRSYHNGKQPDPENLKTGEGPFFAEQFNHAIEVDPELIFITGWNEWVAMRFTDGKAGAMLDKKIKEGDTYFVDQYNEEFSRDLEPMRGGFGDNYYYQMVDFIRRYKGVNNLPVYSRSEPMKIDGKMKKWENINSTYYDDKGDIAKRDHQGWGRYKRYTNDTGRNDITISKVASDGEKLYFYVQTADNLSPHTDNDWMRLFISIRGSQEADWEEFHYVVNNKVKDKKQTFLSKSEGGWNWKDIETIDYAVNKNEMELSIPLSSLGITGDGFTVDFKWIDNAVKDGDIMECMVDGDTAPNNRFRYRFIYKN